MAQFFLTHSVVSNILQFVGIMHTEKPLNVIVGGLSRNYSYHVRAVVLLESFKTGHRLVKACCIGIHYTAGQVSSLN